MDPRDRLTRARALEQRVAALEAALRHALDQAAVADRAACLARQSAETAWRRCASWKRPERQDV